eukprot:gene916-5216_t
MEQVLSLIKGENKPFGLQNLVDRLAHVGLKKAQIQKALDQLTEKGELEFGKTKIFMPPQNLEIVLSKEEMDSKSARLKELQLENQQKLTVVKSVESELAGWKSSEGIEGKEADLFEDMGVETDEVMGCNFQALEDLLPGSKGGMSKRQRV